jgi:type II secretory pathway component PulF
LPGFHEASLAQLASAISLMLKKGTPLPQAIAMAETLESSTPAAAQLAEWRKLTEAGQGNPAKWPAPQRPFPPLFLWLIQNGGNDLASGFQKASEIYQARASYRIELLLYGALPVSILLLAQMILWQVVPLMRSMVWMMNALGDMGGS